MAAAAAAAAAAAVNNFLAQRVTAEVLYQSVADGHDTHNSIVHARNKSDITLKVVIKLSSVSHIATHWHM